MIPYFKKNVGSWCQERSCKKRRVLGDDIDYVISGRTLCKDHAQKECVNFNIQLPGSVALSNADQEIVDFLKKNLQLAVRYSGGCPEENFPADREIYLVLNGEVISEVNIDG